MEKGKEILEPQMISFSIEVATVIVLLCEIIRSYFLHKNIKALAESAKTSNQRLDDVEKELRDKNS